MNLTRALSNAVTGLQASGRGTETVSSNLANIMTPGFARRELSVSSQSWAGGTGGVRVDGVNRIVNDSLLAETRIANASRAGAEAMASFLNSAERLIGIPGETGSLGSRISRFQAALVSAAARPDEEVRLSEVVSSATAIARHLNEIGDGIQSARLAADQQITREVASLNRDLERVAELNRRIASLVGSGVETASMEDERQSLIDRISDIVPVRQVERPGNKVALFAAGGAILLDGSKPASIEFTPAALMSAGMTVASGQLGLLSIGGQQVPSSRLHLVGGGTLAASFAIRDEIAPALQREVDAVALELHDRLSDGTVDTTLSGQPGLFTDKGGSAALSTITGLSSRLQINAAVDPSAGGQLWKIRDGLGAAAAGPVGDGRLLDRMAEALARIGPISDGTTFSGAASVSNLSGQLSSRVGTRRVAADGELAGRSAQAHTLGTRLAAEGVDSDAEMRRLIQYEHAYSANAKVIQTIDEMLATLMRI